MNSGDKFRAKGSVYGTVAPQTAHALESIGPDLHIKVAFHALGKAGMAAVTFGVIHDLQFARCKSFTQSVFDILPFRHFFQLPPSLSVPAV